MTPKVTRRTKIVATIGPASESDDMIARLISAGVNVFRLNFSHGTAAHHARVARRIRKQATIAGNYVGILADLQGPKIRISNFRSESVELAQGDRFRQTMLHIFEGKEAERVVLWAAADETMVAGQIAECTGNLEPDVVQLLDIDLRRGRVIHEGSAVLS